mmetsp:Transcript_49719/g.140158  ORF Transcript_49719/g.140158 Transcript_49719/m.140158 type:complete len:544 (-) Transcript_49719:46-1677(-)
MSGQHGLATSLLVALHLLAGHPAAPAAAALLVVVVRLVARLHVHLVHVVRLHRVHVGDEVLLALVRLQLRHVQRRRQELAHGLLVLRAQRGGEVDRQNEEEVPVHEGVLVGRHPLVLDRLDQPARRAGARVLDDVHRAAPPGLLGLQRLLPRALLEVGAAVAVDDEHADVDALALELRLARLLQRVDVGRVRLRDVVDVRAVVVRELLPLHLAILLLGERVEPVRHRLHDLAGGCLDEQLPPVEVRELELEAAQRLHERDVPVDEQVGALPPKLRVVGLLQHEDHVAGVRVRVLVGHAVEDDLVAVGRALLDVDLQDLALLLPRKGLPLPAARAARRLHLLDHRAHPDHLHLHAPAVAVAAGLDPLLLVDDLPRDRHLLRRPVVHLLQRDLQRLHHVLGLLARLAPGAPTAAGAPEEGAEDVGRVPALVAVEALLAEPVVLLPLLRVAEYLVGARDFLEPLRIPALVGVVLHRELPVGLLDVGLGRLPVDLQQLVEGGGVDVPLGAPPPAGAVHAGHAWEPTEKHDGLAGSASGCAAAQPFNS